MWMHRRMNIVMKNFIKRVFSLLTANLETLIENEVSENI